MFILIFDDDEMNNALMAQALIELRGCETWSFTRPADALAFVRLHGQEVSLAITDYDMPGMNGVEFIREARLDGAFAHAPIIMLTSMNQRALRRGALAVGATDFLAKPFDATEVKSRMSNLLALNQAGLDEQDRAAWLTREVAKATAVIDAREREIVTMLMRGRRASRQ